MSDNEQGMCWHGDPDGEGHPYVRPQCPARQVISNRALGITPRAERDT